MNKTKRAFFLFFFLCTFYTFAQNQNDTIIDGVSGTLPGRYNSVVILYPDSFSEGTELAYRFSDDGKYEKFDRSLHLDAFYGEEREYSLEFLNLKTKHSSKLTYIIDKKSPPAPIFLTPSGDVGSYLEVKISGKEKIFYSVDGQDYKVWTADSVIRQNADLDSTKIVNAKAYAVDELGNYSAITCASWRLCPDGMSPSSPYKQDDTSLRLIKAQKDSGLSIEKKDMTGNARVTIKAPDGTVPCIAVGNKDQQFGIETYAILSSDKSVVTTTIPFPWGYDKEIYIKCGYKSGTTIYYENDSVVFIPQFPEENIEETAPSIQKPNVFYGNNSIYISWANNPWTIMYSVDDGPFNIYTSPLLIATPKNEHIKLSYYAINKDGITSSTGMISLSSRNKIEAPFLIGVENGSVYGKSIKVSVPEKTIVRYEYSTDDSMPKAITAESKNINSDGEFFSGIEGKKVKYKIRYFVEETDNYYSTERLINFSIDKEAPPVPILADSNDEFSDDTIVSFVDQSEQIFVSISENKTDKNFIEYKEPIRIKSFDEGRKYYYIRAYSVDEFGNTSLEMNMFPLLIDKSSLYVDMQIGKVGAKGKPDDPIKYLDDAIELAEKGNIRNIYVKGDNTIKRCLTIPNKLNIFGSFDLYWNETSQNSTINISDISKNNNEQNSCVVVSLTDSELNLQNLNFNIDNEENLVFVSAVNGKLNLENVSFNILGNNNKSIIEAVDSEIDISTMSAEFKNEISSVFCDLDGGIINAKDLSISANSNLKMFTAMQLKNAEANIDTMGIYASPSFALYCINAVSTKLNVKNSFFNVSRGLSSCRIISSTSSDIDISSTYFNSNWKGTYEAFFVESDSSVIIKNITAILVAKSITFCTCNDSKLLLANSIINFDSNNKTANSKTHNKNFVLLNTNNIDDMKMISNCIYGTNNFVLGSKEILSISDINILPESKNNFSEKPEQTFLTGNKETKSLLKNSKCYKNGTIFSDDNTEYIGNEQVELDDKKTINIGASQY